MFCKTPRIIPWWFHYGFWLHLTSCYWTPKVDSSPTSAFWSSLLQYFVWQHCSHVPSSSSLCGPQEDWHTIAPSLRDVQYWFRFCKESIVIILMKNCCFQEWWKDSFQTFLSYHERSRTWGFHGCVATFHWIWGLKICWSRSRLKTTAQSVPIVLWL